MKLTLAEIVGPWCSDRQNRDEKKGGIEIRNRIEQNWATESKITISFAGVQSITPSFIDEAIGKLVDEFPLSEIRDKLEFEGYNDVTKNRINTSIRLRLEKKRNVLEAAKT